MHAFTHEFLEYVPIGICAFDANGRLTSVNSEAMRALGGNVQLGVTETEMLHGFRLYDPAGTLVPLDSYPVTRALRTKTEIPNEEIVLETPGGQRVIFLLSVRTVLNPDGTQKGAIAAVRDITAWRNSENAYRESEARYERAARAGKVGVWDFDVRTGELYISPLLKELLGYTEDELPNSMEAWCHLVHPDDVAPMIANTQARLAGTDRSYEIECRRMHKDGSYHDFRVRGSIIRAADGTPLRITGSDTDITDQKRIDSELREAGRRKDEFLAMLAHELRNPLAAISNAAQLLTMPEMADMADWCRDVIERQVGQLTRLIDDLLDVSRITRGKIELRTEIIDPATVIYRAIDAVKTQMRERNHTVNVDVSSSMPRIDGDPTRLEQVLVNLLTNAAKYTPEGGTVEIAAQQDGDDIVIEVRDNGMGIGADVLPKVFDLFAQDKRSLDRSLGGLGIGLTIVERLVSMHGGTVFASSDGPGKGSVFTLRLPVAIDQKLTVAPVVRTLAAAPRMILIIDDNHDNATGMAALLRRAGHRVVTAHEGTRGVELVEEHRPDVVLLDIGLPGLDGYEVARRVRAHATVQPVLIAVSGYAQDADRRHSSEAGFDHHLAKPVDMDELVDLIALTTSNGMTTDKSTSRNSESALAAGVNGTGHHGVERRSTTQSQS